MSHDSLGWSDEGKTSEEFIFKCKHSTEQLTVNVSITCWILELPHAADSSFVDSEGFRPWIETQLMCFVCPCATAESLQNPLYDPGASLSVCVCVCVFVCVCVCVSVCVCLCVTAHVGLISSSSEQQCTDSLLLSTRRPSVSTRFWLYTKPTLFLFLMISCACVVFLFSFFLILSLPLCASERLFLDFSGFAGRHSASRPSPVAGDPNPIPATHH